MISLKPPATNDNNLRQTRREHVHRHYSRVISLALSALDDGSQSPTPSRDLIEWLISALGFHCEEWTRLTDEELVDFASCAGRLSDDVTRNRIIERIRKARQRFLKWQEKEENPILIDYRTVFEHAEDSEPGRPKGKTYSEYQLPFGELVADIIEEAPAGTRNDRLKTVVRRHTRAYLQRFSGAARLDKKKREHSPESDLKRAATVAKKAVDREEKKSGQRSAIAEFCSVFNREFAGIVHFSPRDDKSINRSNLEKVCEWDTCPADFSDNAPENNNLAEKRDTSISELKSVEFCHVSEEKSVAQLPGIGREPSQGSHPPEGEALRAAAAAVRGCDPSRDSDVSLGTRPPEHVELDAFRSVGANRFEYFFVDPATDKKTGAYHEVTAGVFASEVTDLVGDAERGGVSFVVRPRIPEESGAILHLDDFDAESALLLGPFAFLVKETSDDSFHLFLAFKDPWDKADAASRLFPRLEELKLSGNHGSGGATRWSGSVNAKPSRNGFRVRVDSVNAGRFTTPSELDDAGLLADPPAPTELDWTPGGPAKAWPDYQRCLKDKNGDRSNADAQFVYFSLTRNRTTEEIAEKLAEVSDKAKDGGEKYINRTIAAGVEYLRSEVSR